jgi:transposase-like protein
VLALLERCGGNVSRAARHAGLPRSTFRDHLRHARRAALDDERPSEERRGEERQTGVRTRR